MTGLMVRSELICMWTFSAELLGWWQKMQLPTFTPCNTKKKDIIPFKRRKNGDLS